MTQSSHIQIPKCALYNTHARILYVMLLQATRLDPIKQLRTKRPRLQKLTRICTALRNRTLGCSPDDNFVVSSHAAFISRQGCTALVRAAYMEIAEEIIATVSMNAPSKAKPIIRTSTELNVRCQARMRRRHRIFRS